MPAVPSAQPERKKRRQNVACDSCRLRRVKCDMLAILTPKDTTRAVPPLHVLVQENPGVSCSNCISKGIRCTTHQIVNPAKPNKGGKRIEEAKKVYGSDGTALSPPSGASQVVTLDNASTGSGSNTQFTTTPVPVDSAGLDMGNEGGVFPMANMFPTIDSLLPASSSAGTTVNPGLLDHTIAQNPWPVEWESTALSTRYGTPFAGGMYDSSFASFSAPPLPLSAEYDNVFAASTPQPMSSSLPVASSSSTQGYRTERFGSTGETFNYPAVDDPFQQQVVSRKRTLSGDGDGLFALDELQETNTPNPWASVPGNTADRSVRWTRREQVAERLADRALESELSRHLVRVYFQAVHLTLPGISPESFFLEWRRAGERSDRMTPSQEVLCAVLEAWAARFSDHPVVLGFDPKDPDVYHYSPKVILDTGEFVPASPDRPDRSNFGVKRLKACLALANRVRKLIDLHGILRKPTVEGVQALVLFSHLQHMTDVDGDTTESLMESEMLHSTAISQMKVLKMSWSVEENNLSLDGYENQTQKGHWRFIRLFWTLVVSDSFWAAASCNEPKILDRDMEATQHWMAELEMMDGPHSLRKLAFILKGYFNYCEIARTVARKISVPSARPGRVDVDDFCRIVRQLWADIQTLYNDINANASIILGDKPEQMLGTSPVHSLASLRQCGTFILLIICHIVREVLKFRKTILASYGESPSDQKTLEAGRVAAMEELNQKAVDVTLAMARAQAPLFKTLLPTGMLQASAMMTRVLISTTEFLSNIPTNEQGYPNTTLGGIEWTWANKEKEVEGCIEALYQLGWAWSDAAGTLDKVRNTMRQMQPDVQTLMAYAAKAKPRGYRELVAKRERDLERDAKSFDAAMMYWPPRCVPMTLDLIYDNRVEAGQAVVEPPREPASYSGSGTASEREEEGGRVAAEVFSLPAEVYPPSSLGDGPLTGQLDALLESILNADPVSQM